jgi:hypothetical protein
VDAVVSVQRYIVAGRHLFLADKVPMLGGEVVIKEADHARIVAEMERQHAAALAEAVSVIEGLADQQAMYDGWYVEPLERLRAAAAAAPRTLTADDARAAVVRLTNGLRTSMIRALSVPLMKRSSLSTRSSTTGRTRRVRLAYLHEPLAVTASVRTTPSGARKCRASIRQR